MVATAPQPRTGTSTATRLAIIDADVHPAIADYTQLHPYLPETWRRHVSARGFGGPNSGIIRGQGGLYRTDVRPPGGEPGSDPDFLREQLMERYNVRYPSSTGATSWGSAPSPIRTSPPPSPAPTTTGRSTSG